MSEPDYRLGKHRGKFVVVWYEDGERQRRSLGTDDRTVAEATLAEFIAARQRRLNQELKTIRQIYEFYEAGKKGHPALSRIQDAWKALGPHFAAVPFDGLDEATCKAYERKRRKMGRSQGTIHTELGYLATALAYAKRKRAIPFAPDVWRPPKPRAKERYLTRQEAVQLVNACGMPHVRLFVILALTTAGRASAILDLTWDRVDLKAGRIKLDNPERDLTAKGRATVPINAWAREALQEAQQGALSDHVIEWGGRPVKSIKKGVRLAAERAGLEGVTPHVLRHTAAVWMAGAGIPIPKIAQYLGHTDSRITERTYARFAPDYLQDAADVLDLHSDLLGSGTSSDEQAGNTSGTEAQQPNGLTP